MPAADYSQFGSNYNAPVNFDDQAQQQGAGQGGSAGQPRRWQPQAQQGVQPGSQAPQTAPTSQGGQNVHAPTPVMQSPTQGMTFQQMQQSGYARPPAPQGQGGFNLEQNLTTAYQHPGRFNYSPYQAQAPQSGQFHDPTQGTALAGQTQQSVQSLLSNPSPYLTDAFQSQLKQTMGSIDDDYNRRDAALQGSIASRGLDSTGTIGATNQTFQNLQRRTAQSDGANNLLNQLATTYGSDRSNAINTAMGYGGQQYSQAANTNQQNFGQNLNAAQFGQGAQQQGYTQAQNTYAMNNNLHQQALENLFGYGNTQFDHQVTTNQLNQNADAQRQQYELALANLGLA